MPARHRPTRCPPHPGPVKIGMSFATSLGLRLAISGAATEAGSGVAELINRALKNYISEHHPKVARRCGLNRAAEL